MHSNIFYIQLGPAVGLVALISASSYLSSRPSLPPLSLTLVTVIQGLAKRLTRFKLCATTS